ncbi:PREDICTED: uncharacterized protein LOC104802484 [Tarenaya hassleriana]|uniref:uncharacterized protein LOC104802484 n=1 Tax=Tarenaya hassleriana TaxID=28532 RepID=UPI00053C860D|nr:PREDICTED: uncharacterized protein LOC104802484 [Tarenaya hassleriana]
MHACGWISRYLGYARTEKERIARVTGDDLMDNPCSEHAVRRDLLLLENQIPYFILEKLYDAAAAKGKLSGDMSLRQLVLKFFDVPAEINENTKFNHFADFMRCFFVETLDLTEHERKKIEEKRPIRRITTTQ